MIRQTSFCGLLTLLHLVASPADAQDPDGIRLATSSFVVARYSTQGASSLYAGYGMGPVGLFVAAVINPHSDYRELVGGVVSTIAWRSQTLTVAVATADASDGQYLQTYFVPELVSGRLHFSGTIEWYEPLESSGVRQLDVNPLTVAISMGSNLRLGGAYTLGLSEGAEASQRAGPVVLVGIPRGNVYVEWLHRFGESRREVRIGTQLGF